MNILKHKYAHYLLIVIAVLIAHINFLFPEIAENPDSNFIHPFLSRISSPWNYIEQLVSLETIDFQPVRDLTLFFDLWVLKHTGTNVSIFFNLVLWAFSCCVIYSILRTFFHKINETTALLLVSCYSVYPIFLQTINWGIARKHLLAFMFTLLATRAFLNWIETQKGQFKIIIFYTLSVLSIPISIGWPVWCFCYLGLLHRDKLKLAQKLLLVLSIIMILLVMINYAYYNTSLTYLELYPQKAKLVLPYFVILNLGHQIWKLIYPYSLAFHYSLGYGAAAGFVILLSGIGYVIWKHRTRTDIWAWVLFGAAHVSIILTTPTVYYDTYVVAPSFALLILIVLSKSEAIEKYRLLLVPVLIFWTSFTLSKNKIWGTSEDFFSNSFEQDKSCSNAMGLGIAKYVQERKIPNSLFDFIQVNKCFDILPTDPASITTKKIIFESWSLYYEDEIDLDYRKKRLLELGFKHFYPNLVYATLLAKEDDAEKVELVMKNMNEILKGTNARVGDENIFSKVMPAYCKERNLSECNEFIKDRLEKPSR